MYIKLQNLPYIILIAAVISLMCFAGISWLIDVPGQVGVLISSATYLGFATLIIYFAFQNMLLRLLHVSAISYIFLIWLLLCVIFTIPVYLMLGMDLTRCFFFVANAFTTTAIPLTGSWRFETLAFTLWYDLMQWLGGFLTLVSVWVLFTSRQYTSLQSKHPLAVRATNLDEITGGKSRILKRLIYGYLLFTLVVMLIIASFTHDNILAFRASFVIAATGTLEIGSSRGWSLDFSYGRFIMALLMFISAMGVIWAIGVNFSQQRRNIQSFEMRILVKIAIGFALALFLITLFKNYTLNEEIPTDITIKQYLDQLSDILMLIATGQVTHVEPVVHIQIPLAILLSIMGAASLSTAGGLKISRLYFFFGKIYEEMWHMIYPHSVKKIEIAQTQDMLRVRRIWMLATLLIISIMILTIIFGLEELSFERAILSAVAIATNSGGIVTIGESDLINQKDVLTIYSSFGSLLMGLIMIIARLEFVFVFTLGRIYSTLRKEN